MKIRACYISVATFALLFSVSGCALMDAMGNPEASDAGQVDAGDTASPDVGDTASPDVIDPQDASSPDASDAGGLDAGGPDGGEPDAGGPDGGEPDAGGPDGGEPDASTCVSGADCVVCGLSGQEVCQNGVEVCQITTGDLAGVTAENCADKLLFVDTSAANTTDDGTNARPFKTYKNARIKATASGNESYEFIILNSDATLSEELVVANGVSVLGGFKRTNLSSRWTSTNAKAAFSVSASPGQDVFGIKARTIDTPTTLANISVTTADASQGMNNYGAYILNSDALSLHTVSVQSGNAGKGENGDPGDVGADGGPGQSLSDVDISIIIGRYFVYIGKPLGGTPGDGTPVDGEDSPTNPRCLHTTGGDGGLGVVYTSSTQYNDAEDGAATHWNPNAGGSAGLTGGHSSKRNGGDGVVGAAVPPKGNDGSSGTPGGTLDANLWKPIGTGEKGSDGSPGKGGGGGGGAGLPVSSITGLRTAASGAGGGAGGCAGQGGAGGSAGGGSFGLMLIDSEVSLTDSSFSAGKGGDGGVGGPGGPGGQGGQGGQGGDDWVNEHKNRVTYGGAGSGDGGDGSAGGAGGAGGGGAGGASYGLYCSGSSSSITESGNNTFIASTSPASGGSSPGNHGEAGEIEDSKDCP